jgi:tight adherence protein B
MVVLAWYLFALALVVVAVLLLRTSNRSQLRQKVRSHFLEVAFLRLEHGHGESPLRGTAIERWLWRSGIELKPVHVLLFVLVALVLIWLAWMRGGVFGALVAFSIVITTGIVWPEYRHHKRTALMIGQVPLFLDQMVRGLATGRNLDGALKQATEETPLPLSDVMRRVHQAVTLGDDIGSALRDAAHVFGLRELLLVALAVRISHDYGSSPREMLQSVTTLIRNREQIQRELASLTGETRLSAWVLSLLPSGIAAYMVFVNPDYIFAMWNDEGGRTALLMALGFQLVGAFILWRMVKSV